MRHCSAEKGWHPPGLFNCTSASFVQLKAMVGTGMRAGPRAGLGVRQPGPFGQTRVWLGPASSFPLRTHFCIWFADSESRGHGPCPPPSPFSVCHTPRPLPLGTFPNCLSARQALLSRAAVNRALWGLLGVFSGSFLAVSARKWWFLNGGPRAATQEVCRHPFAPRSRTRS